MNPGSIVIRRASTGSGSLVLLFHGVGGRPDNLLALGQRMPFPMARSSALPAPIRRPLQAVVNGSA